MVLGVPGHHGLCVAKRAAVELELGIAFATSPDLTQRACHVLETVLRSLYATHSSVTQLVSKNMHRHKCFN